MTAANRYEAEARTDKAQALVLVLLRDADKLGIAPNAAELIWMLDSLRDGEWYGLWIRARCASPPSDETKRIVRQVLLARLSLDEKLRLIGSGGWGGIVEGEYELSAEDRNILRDLDNARALGTRDQTALEEP